MWNEVFQTIFEHFTNCNAFQYVDEEYTPRLKSLDLHRYSVENMKDH